MFNNDRALAYALLRFTLGINICLHGVQRFGAWGSFAEGVVKQFAPFLPAFVVRPYAYALPAIEAVIGVLLLIGLAQRWALVAGALFMASLTFGTALRGEHAVLSEQLIYEFVYFILLATLAWDRYSLDRAISDRKATSAT